MKAKTDIKLKKITQAWLIMEFFKKNPRRDIKHPEIVAWVTTILKKRNGGIFRDPDRQIRKLAQTGQLQKIAKDVYRYDPDFIVKRALKDFTTKQKNIILKRDNYRCVICGKGIADGVELHIDRIKPKDLGGKTTIENGQVLCGQHNKKKQKNKKTETGKNMFIRIYKLAKQIGDIETQKFCAQILEVFEANNVNGHIQWKR